MNGLEFDFDHWYINDLPGEELPAGERTPVRPRQVHGAAWSTVQPTPTAQPMLIAHSPEVAEMLGISPEQVDSPEFAAVFSGNEVLDGMSPFAANYGGHQFGGWAGQLGDGRAIALAEVNTPNAGHLSLQLKGAGPTPYSRNADGRAVLRSSIREFLCSEAMHHLGIPTTRALSLTLTGDAVVRDMLYDGHAAPEPGAIVCRVAPSFIRFGNFELPASRGEEDLLRALVEHTIRRHFSHLLAPVSDQTAPLDSDVIASFFEEVVNSTADLMVDWMRVGFVHGVMNTDNLSVLGLTIDYGPYGWLENFDPSWTPNTTDAQHKRYRYGDQAQIGLWNLARLGNALYPLIGDVAPLQAALDAYGERFNLGWNAALAAKLGISDAVAVDRQTLIDELLALLPRTEVDMTIFFRTLGDLDVAALSIDGSDADTVAPLLPAYYLPSELVGELLVDTAAWFRTYVAFTRDLAVPAPERRAGMHAVNPKYVLRNYLAQMAIDKAEVGEFSMIGELLDVLRRPYDEQVGREEYASLRPDWARVRVGCSMLSCSS